MDAVDRWLSHRQEHGTTISSWVECSLHRTWAWLHMSMCRFRATSGSRETSDIGIKLCDHIANFKCGIFSAKTQRVLCCWKETVSDSSSFNLIWKWHLIPWAFSCLTSTPNHNLVSSIDSKMESFLFHGMTGLLERLPVQSTVSHFLYADFSLFNFCLLAPNKPRGTKRI